MRSYQQYCGLARGLDVIGDRWVLLIVRELLTGPRRYNELLDGLPGIATNLLADRLRTLQSHGLVATNDSESYVLSERGESLRDVIFAIGRWAIPLMGSLHKGETFRGHWIVHPVSVLFPGVDASRPDVTVELRCDDEPMTICSTEGRVKVQPGHAAAPDLVLTGPPDVAISLLAQRIGTDEAKAKGLTVTGDPFSLLSLRPGRIANG